MVVGGTHQRFVKISTRIFFMGVVKRYGPTAARCSSGRRIARGEEQGFFPDKAERARAGGRASAWR